MAIFIKSSWFKRPARAGLRVVYVNNKRRFFETDSSLVFSLHLALQKVLCGNYAKKDFAKLMEEIPHMTNKSLNNSANGRQAHILWTYIGF